MSDGATLRAHGRIAEDKGVDHWRYKCPHCASRDLRKRHPTHANLHSYVEVDPSMLDGPDTISPEDVADYYCNNCLTPVAADERVETDTEEAWRGAFV